MVELGQLAAALSQSVADEDGQTLASVLRRAAEPAAQLVESDLRAALAAARTPPPYDELLAEQLRAAASADALEAYAHQERACSAFQTVFEKDSDWSLPALRSLALALRLAAARADGALAARSMKASKQQEAARLLQKFFQITVTDRTPLPTSKKWGALCVINALFKIYFAINNLRLCQNLLRAVEGPAFPKALDGQEVEGRRFMLSELVTFKYFVGRLSLLNSDYAAAEEKLSFAFEHCPARSSKNKRLILRSLVPVRLALGAYPTRELLQKYRLLHFVPVCRSAHRGDLRAFDAVLEQYQRTFIRQGSYLLLERSKMIAYRNFFKRIRDLHPEGKQLKLDVRRFQSCLAAAGVSMDVDEIECVLANLIFQGYIKGYISHQHGKLVLSKDNAFPPLRKLLAG